jgi:hypothetical protein
MWCHKLHYFELQELKTGLKSWKVEKWREKKLW